MNEIKKTMIATLIAFCLLGCSKTSVGENSSTFYVYQTTNDSEESNTAVSAGIAPYISEEEQFKSSDIVCLVKAGKKGNTVIINTITYTIYYFEINELLKGEEMIDYACFLGDTTESSREGTSIDESIQEGKNYKLFLRKIGDYYMTTAGLQSIINV